MNGSKTAGMAHSQSPGKSLTRILYVEDEELNVGLVRTFLHELEIVNKPDCTSARAAIQANFEEGAQPFDAYLLDMGLPGGTGADLAHEVRKQEKVHGKPPSRIVMFSGDYLPAARLKTADLPNVGYLQKPRDVGSLKDALEGNYSR